LIFFEFLVPFPDIFGLIGVVKWFGISEHLTVSLEHPHDRLPHGTI
jgi:hypothetical protein